MRRTLWRISRFPARSSVRPRVRCRQSEKQGGGAFSWGDALLRPSTTLMATESFQPSIPISDLAQVSGEVTHPPVTPLDEYNVKLLDNCKPQNWQDPDPGDTRS